MKRCISFILAFVMILAMLPMGVSAAQGDKLIALTFDDGPHKTHTVTLLDGLSERNAKATFFTLGQNANANLDLIRRAYAEGHEIACHSWDHPNLVELKDSTVVNQVENSMAVLDEVCGNNAAYLFRPPYGSTNERVRDLIPYPLIMWSIDPEDWKHRDENYVRDMIVDNAYDGAIILVHDIHGTTIPGALAAVDKLMAEGYEFVTVSELFRRRGVALEPKKRYYDCKNNGTDYGPIPKPEITYTTDGSTMKITISANTDAPIYYTTDGSVPNEQSPVYKGPITSAFPCNIHAVAAYKLNGSRSDMAVLAPEGIPAESPEFSVQGGKLTLSTSSKGADIYYTTDGSDPMENGTTYSGPIDVSGGCEIRAVVTGTFYKTSPEIRRYFTPQGRAYADMKPGEWYYEPIDRLVSEGLMVGVGDDQVIPQTDLTRGMLVTMLYTYSKESLEEGWEQTHGFTDVEPDRYYSEAVEWVYRKGIVSGYAEDQFGPDNAVTRQELCKIMDRFLLDRGHALPVGESCDGKFEDYDQIAFWALSSVEAMASAGLIGGDGFNLTPRANTSRAEAAAVFVKMMDYEASFQQTKQSK